MNPPICEIYLAYYIPGDGVNVLVGFSNLSSL